MSAPEAASDGLLPGDRVKVGPVVGEVVYVAQTGCCGGGYVAVRLDVIGTVVYGRFNEVRRI